MIRKLRKRFILSAMLATLLVLTVLLGVIHVVNYRKIAVDADKLLEILLENGGQFPKQDKRMEHDAPFSRKLSPETPYESRYFIVTADAFGEISAVNTGKIAAVSTEDAVNYSERILQNGRTSGFIYQYRYAVEKDGEKQMLVFLDCSREFSSFRGFLYSSIVVSAIGLVSVFVLIVFFSKIVLKPVIESYGKQKQFITDAGHEIKTPLTIIDASTEVLEMEFGESEWTQSIRGQVQRLSSLTSDLIALSRMEEAAEVTMLEFSLSDAVQETAEAFRPMAFAQKKEYSVQVVQGISYCGDEKLIRRLLSVLVDNALKYSQEGGQIRITLQRQGKKCCILVYNTAQNLPRGELPQLFDRFYRTDQSRNSQTGGYGIGLSVAKAIVEAHKGKITAQSADGISLMLTVLL